MEPTAEVVLVHGTAQVPTLVYVPEGGGPRPAIVISAEAFGINSFTKEVASDLASAGYVVVVPDYYRGEGLRDPESYHDFTEVLTFIDELDFVGATHDIMAAVDHARAMPEVDPERVALWGYCTGATFVMLAAALDRRLAAAVAFFPSQPTFPELTPKRPVQPIDLLWNVACPFQLLYGDQDSAVEVYEEMAKRFEQWGIEHEIRVYEHAGHAFERAGSADAQRPRGRRVVGRCDDVPRSAPEAGIRSRLVTDLPPPPSEPPPPSPPPLTDAPPAGAYAVVPAGVVPPKVGGAYYSRGLVILLSIVTLGIWTALWTWRTNDDLKKWNGDGLGPGIALVLWFVFSPVLMFTIPNEIGHMYERDGRGRPISAVWGLWVLLPLVGPFIWYFKVQRLLNEFWLSKGSQPG